MNIPALKPMAFDGNLKINFCSKQQAMDLDKEERLHLQRKKHDAANFAKKRRKMKKILQSKLCQKRKKEMKKHRNEFGKEEDYFSEDEYDDEDQHEEDEDEDEDYVEEEEDEEADNSVE